MGLTRWEIMPMSEQGTVVFAPHDGFVVVQHAGGFAVVEITEDGTGIGCGNDLQAPSWDGLGGETLYRGKVAYEAMFWGSYDELTDAKEKALKFVFNLYDPPGARIH